MKLTPYQNDIWIKLCANILTQGAGLSWGVAIFGLYGARFMDHQIKVGLLVGLIMFGMSLHILRYLSPTDNTD